MAVVFKKFVRIVKLWSLDSGSLSVSMHLFVFLSVCLSSVCCQYYGDRGNYFPGQSTDGEPQHLPKTYIYNSRRYGQPVAPPELGYPPNRPYQPNFDPNAQFPSQYPNQYNPNVNNPYSTNFDETYKLGEDFTNKLAQLPGVLGIWRPDLQGKKRPGWNELERDIIVETNYGQIQGFKVFLYDNPDPKDGYRPGMTPVEHIKGNVSVFLGIPYALPPIGDGRFKPPRPHPVWQAIQAVDFGPACPQHIKYTGAFKGVRAVHEDCLYLNVYSPYTKSGLARKYPVMFYIHGGDFSHGASNLFPAHILAGFYDVVVVTFNYRLGALGFLSTGDDNSPGNYGILDQAMALQWVYDNIEFFNGDKNSITLFGPDAGAASAGLLMVNPRTRHMISKVIAQSGSATASWALVNDRWKALNTSRIFAQHLGCSIETTGKMLDCLKKARSADEIGDGWFNASQAGLIPWGPVLDLNISVPADWWYEGWNSKDWRFTNFTAEQDIKAKNFNRYISYMTGVTTQEAAYFLLDDANRHLAPYYEIDQKFFDQKLRELILQYNYTLNQEGVFHAIKFMYTHRPDPDNPYYIREQYINMLSDFLFRAPVDHIVKLLVSQDVPTYMYVMNTTVEALRLPEWRKYPHNIEHYFLTGAPFMDTEFFPPSAHLERNMWTDNDRNMSHFFMKAYSNFAKYGNPTYEQILGIHFEKATAGQFKYLNLNTTFNSTIMYNYRQTESAFWWAYLPYVIGTYVPTYPPTTEFFWEPRAPLQIAFWSMSTLCLILLVAVVIFCMLWRNVKRTNTPYYSCDVSLRDESEMNFGIENRNHRSTSNIYGYRDSSAGMKPRTQTNTLDSRKTYSTPSLRTGSISSLKEEEAGYVSTIPTGDAKASRTPPIKRSKSRTIESNGIPQTEV
nr:PREDICTED: acetylcholinesterase [Bemisia tabaci]